MFMAPIDPPPRRHDHVVVRLMRRWVAERDGDGAALPSLVQLGQRLGIDPQAAIAIASMLQLTEYCLGRPLAAECCCSPRLGADERAVLLMLATACLRSPLTPAAIPRGLPGALLWAVESVRRLLFVNTPVTAAARTRCPFVTDPDQAR